MGEEWANDVWGRRRNRYKRSLRSSTEEMVRVTASIQGVPRKIKHIGVGGGAL